MGARHELGDFMALTKLIKKSFTLTTIRLEYLVSKRYLLEELGKALRRVFRMIIDPPYPTLYSHMRGHQNDKLDSSSGGYHVICLNHQ